MGLEATRRRRWPVGARAAVFVAILAAGAWAAAELDLLSGSDGPGEAGFSAAGEFFSRAFSPALRSEAPPPFGGRLLLEDVVRAAVATVVFAAAALGLAMLLGSGLGFLGSTAWWAGDPGAARRGGAGLVGRVLRPAVYGATRVVIALLRSVHEILWAVLLLCAFGRSDLSAVVAIAIPYSGIFAKLVSEVIDEAPRGAALALRAAGASPVQVFAIGLLPRAVPDVTANAFYQFECALRSATVLGFFGFPTLGYYLSASFENLYYGEVWTYLYALFVLILGVEWWSGALRRRTMP